MDKIIVNKNKLIEIIQKNKKEHIDDYKKSMKGYSQEYEGYLDSLRNHIDNEIKEIRESNYTKDVNLSFYFDEDKPISHEEDYNAILSMLELDCNDSVELSRRDHECFVMDKWNWKGDFLRVSSKYK